MPALFAARYALQQPLGHGAQGLALQVLDTLHGQQPAVLKIGISGHEHLDRTIAEFDALRALASPYIAPVLELGFAAPGDVLKALRFAGHPSPSMPSSPRPFLVRAWIDGPHILRWAQDHQPEGEALASVLAHLATATHLLHQAGLVHGDLKPDHVLILSDAGQPRPVLIDFGLASSASQEGRGGTPGYLAPERLRGAPASPASDRFALGVLLAQTLAGQRVPVSPASSLDHLPLDLLQRQLPARLLHSIRRLLDPDPAQRPTLDTVATDLLPPERATLGFEPLPARQLPLLGARRLDAIAQLAAGLSAGSLPPVVILSGPHGAGRSRALQHVGYNLQSRGVPTLDVPQAAAPYQRLLLLGPRLAALHDATFTPPSMLPHEGDRPHWLHRLSGALAEAAPPGSAAILWDDLAEHADDAEALAHVLELTRPHLQLITTATAEEIPMLRALFAPVGFHIAPLPPLERRDLDPLGLPPTQLDDLYAAIDGLPSNLQRLLGGEGPVDAAGSPLAHPWLVAAASLLPEGATLVELSDAARRLDVPAAEVRAAVQQALDQRLLSAVPSIDPRQPTRFVARLQLLERLDAAQQRRLGAALLALAQAHPHLAILANALLDDDAATAEAWRRYGGHLVQLHAPHLTLTVLQPALRRAVQPDLLNIWSDAAIDAGSFQRAIDALRELRARRAEPDASALRVAEARIAFAAGSLDAASALLEGLDDQTPAILRAHAEHTLAQIELRRGLYPAARRRALDAARLLHGEDAESEPLRAELRVLAAAACAFLGEQEPDDPEHEEHLDPRLLPPRAQARYHALRALAAYVRGDLDQATDRYRVALEIVEVHHLDADKPLYLLNLGTAWERQGRLAMAREYYNAGIRACTPSSRPSTRALLLANRANVDVKLGRPDEARELLDAATRIAEEGHLGAVLRFIQHLRADAEAAVDQPHLATDTYARCAADYLQSGDRRHATELFLKAGLSAARAGQPQRARALLGSAEPHLEDFPDLKHLANILHAELSIARGGIDALAGIDRYLRALERALEEGDDLAVLTQARYLQRTLQRHTHDPLPGQQLLNLTSRAWRRVALALPPEIRTGFARYLEIDEAASQPQPAPAPAFVVPRSSSGPATAALPGDPGTRLPAPRLTSAGSTPGNRPSMALEARDVAERFYRMLSLNRRILGESDLSRLIPAALDIAIELAQAERGFLLLRDEAGALEVAFSRDVDGRAISQAQLEVSATVAQQVASTGQPVLASHAATDARFQGAQSVVQLQLASVLCVPIQDRERGLGCLYLDHRSRQDAFDDDTARMIRAYADQVAIALVSAHHVRSLERERDRLQSAQARIQTLLAEKDDLLADLQTRCERLEAEVSQERTSTSLRYNYDRIVAQAPSMRAVLALVDRIVDTTLPVVIRGESGTGKELIARAIHFNGPRKNAPFIAVNCGALTETLLESELFGHKKGAFTGANVDRRGLFEAAHKGTLFLDEVGEMSPGMQVKLLRALQEQRIRPVGTHQEIPVDVRVLTATHRDLHAMIQRGEFRQDLFYRMATFVLQLPPLRDRREDIPLLVQRFIQATCAQTGRPTPHVGGDAVRLLLQYPWPGNIRQLENVVQAAIALSGESIAADLLATLLQAQSATGSSAAAAATTPHADHVLLPSGPGRPRKRSLEEVRQALSTAGGDRQAAADLLGISTRTLHRYLLRLQDEAGKN